MTKKEVICTFYLHVHHKISERWNNVVSIKDAKSFLFQWRIPKELRPIIIKELELMGLLKKKGKHLYEIEPAPIDMDNIKDLCEHYDLF